MTIDGDGWIPCVTKALEVPAIHIALAVSVDLDTRAPTALKVMILSGNTKQRNGHTETVVMLRCPSGFVHTWFADKTSFIACQSMITFCWLEGSTATATEKIPTTGDLQ